MNTEGGSSTSLQPQMLSALETLSLTEIMQGNHLRTLRDADVCVRGLGHELHSLDYELEPSKRGQLAPCPLAHDD